MKINDAIKYQSEVVSFLSGAYKKNRLAHSYIFEGEHGTGTYEIALYFAMMLKCKDENGPCLKCNICERIMFNSHMNVITIEPFNNIIKKEQIDGLMSDFHHTTIEGGTNIYIIKDANLMNASAENALLKLLEEPNQENYVIMTTTNHLTLLPTINSRCQLLKFKTISSSKIEEELLNKKVNTDMAYVISKFTSDVEEAEALANDDSFVEIYNFSKKIMLSKFRKNEAMIEYIVNKKILTEKEKKYNKYFIEIIILILERYFSKNKDTNNFKDIYAAIEKNEYSKANLINMISVLENYSKRIDSNVNLDLMYTSLFIEI